ncbi:MAG: phosphoglucosamine mutase [Burkholderiales bacterium]|nr:phosphoglucosamine mutase [Burkholderiales bacterium]
MTRKYFGTDGIRGRVGVAPITPEFVMRLGYAAGRVLTRSEHSISTSPAVLIGKDTRISGYMLESALQAGLSAAGVDSHLTGPMPTPAVAYLTRALRLQAGIVISASHNPYDDNGIKFFSAAGEKLDDGIECAIEAGLNDLVRTVASEKLGKAYRIKDAAGRYIEFCKSAFPNELDLRGMRIVVDCAHGATYHVAPHVFHELGAEVVSIGVQPDGLNINAGFGATETDALKQAVLREHADIGIALDGDGDRVMMIDASGALFDGDQLLFLMARHRQQEGRLKGGVVGTAMTNLGVEQAFRQLNIPFARAKVGDRYVLEMLKARGWQLGGEGSGHIICLDKHTTGDGIVSALQVLHLLRIKQTTLAECAAALTLYPQILINVKFARRFNVDADPAVKARVAEAESAMADRGRVLLRASGTEPVVRVMVEAEKRDVAEQWAQAIARQVRDAEKAAHPNVAGDGEQEHNPVITL